MTHGSLFSGVGGFDLAAKWMGWENRFHCEIDDFKRHILKQKYPEADSHKDVLTTDFTVYKGIDVLTGGWPCQDASIANQYGGQMGLRGSRTGLFYQFERAIGEVRPSFAVGENVSNFIRLNGGRDFRDVLDRLAGMGYNAEWRCCYASEVGAPQKRKRLYLVAYSGSIRLQEGFSFFSDVYEETSPQPWEFAGTSVPLIRGGAWSTEPPVVCVDNGVSSGLVRKFIHGYGNAVVPQIVHKIFKTIMDVQTTSGY